MVTLRCTRKLLERLKARPEGEDYSPATILGDWYVNLLHLGRRQVVLCVSEKTFLPLVLAAKDSASLPMRFVEGVAWTLSRIGVPQGAIREEIGRMDPLAIGRTRSRQVLGVMNEMAFALSFMMAPHKAPSLEDAMLMLAGDIYSPIGYQNPAEATWALFGVNQTSAGWQL